MTFKIYDVCVDEFRDLTQDDLDSLQNVTAAFGWQRSAERAVAEVAIMIGQGKCRASEAKAILMGKL